MRILAIVHVFYPEFWPELVRCLHNVGAACDVVVTLPAGSDFVAKIHQDLPAARVIFCDNRGFDIWPFFSALDEVGLSGYTHILKIHTKRDVHTCPPTVFNAFNYEGPRWRNALLSFISDKAAFARCRALFEKDTSVSMVAGRDVILRRRDVKHPVVRQTFDEALSYAATAFGIHPKRPRFVAGTMFIAKADIFKPFIGRFSALDFEKSVKNDSVVTRAHLLERILGFAACASGRIADPDDSMLTRHLKSDLSYATEALGRFFYQSKTTRSGARMTKLFRIPIWYSRRKPV